MRSICAVLLTFVWLASWAGIVLGLAGCLTPPEPAPAPVVVAVDR